jgi:hypothetical protein
MSEQRGYPSKPGLRGYRLNQKADNILTVESQQGGSAGSLADSTGSWIEDFKRRIADEQVFNLIYT